MVMLSGGELVLRTLRAAGVEKIFGLHGAHIDTVFQAALDHHMPVIDTRHEMAAGHAAEGYARTSNRLGVALVTAGGGFTNCITPLATARLDRTPILLITGSGALRDSETNTLQAGIDQVAIAVPVTKWAHRITAASQIPRLLAQAIRIALTGPRGPVMIDIPWDVLTEQIEEADVSIPPIDPQPQGAPADAGSVAHILEQLAEAQRPAILVGSEVIRAGGQGALHNFSTHTGIPVFADYEAGGLLSGLGDHSGGFIQNLFTFRDQRPDVLLMLGLRFGLYTWHGAGQLISHDAYVIQIDPDARELGRLQPVARAITADPAATLDALNAAVTQRSWPSRTGWRSAVQGIIARRVAAITHRAHEQTPIHPWRAVNAIADHIDEDTIVVADGAEAYLWLTEVMHRTNPAAFLTHGYLGSMGVGMGNALGAQVAAPGKRVLLVTGDGSVGYGIAEFDSMIRHGISVIVIILNNRAWGATLHFQEFAVGANRITNTRLENGDYEDVARGFGVESYTPSTLDEFHSAIKRAKSRYVPACINLRIDLNAIPPEEMMLMGQNPFPDEQKT